MTPEVYFRRLKYGRAGDMKMPAKLTAGLRASRVRFHLPCSIHREYNLHKAQIKGLKEQDRTESQDL